MTGNRADRVADLIHRSLARLLQTELRDPRIGFVTLTHVKLSSDLRHAVVFVTILDEEHRAGSVEALNRTVPFLRRSLAREAGLRFTPQLKFVYDEAEASGQRLDAILSDIDGPPGALMDGDFEGLLLVAKPTGPTSHDLVAQVRRCTRQRRVGHAGTLDPLASGLLPLVLGRATRLVRFLPHAPKIYSGTIQLGRATDTDDITGQVTSRHAGPLPDADRVTAAARRLEGCLSQIPPAFSARKVAGKRLYRLARQGVAVEAPPAEVEVSRFELEPVEPPGLYAFVAEVSAGTYIRALARDLGADLGCGGILASLVRDAIGPMRLETAVELDTDPPACQDQVARAVIPLEQIPLAAETLRLSNDDQARRFCLGASVPAGSVVTGGAEPIRVLGPSGGLLGMAESRDGMLLPRVVLAHRD